MCANRLQKQPPRVWERPRGPLQGPVTVEQPRADRARAGPASCHRHHFWTAPSWRNASRVQQQSQLTWQPIEPHIVRSPAKPRFSPSSINSTQPGNRSRTTSMLRSVDPLSTTSTSSDGWCCASTASKQRASSSRVPKLTITTGTLNRRLPPRFHREHSLDLDARASQVSPATSARRAAARSGLLVAMSSCDKIDELDSRGDDHSSSASSGKRRLALRSRATRLPSTRKS